MTHVSSTIMPLGRTRPSPDALGAALAGFLAATLVTGGAMAKDVTQGRSELGAVPEFHPDSASAPCRAIWTRRRSRTASP